VKKILFISTLALLTSCTSTPDITAEELLEKTIETLGKRALYNSELSFMEREISYTSLRSKYQYEYTMKRSVDTINYFAKSYNGGFEYTENGVPVSYGATSGQLEKDLIDLNQFMILPANFENDNAVLLNLKNDISIDGIEYYVLHISFKNQMPTDLAGNYNLYIAKDTYEIDFIGYDSLATEGRFFLKEAFNKRVLNGVSFSDYRTYISQKNISTIDSLPVLLGKNQLVLRNPLVIKNINVKLLD